MGDDKPDQKTTPDQSKLEKTPAASIDQLKTAEDLASQALKSAQQTETRNAGTAHEKGKAAIQAAVDAKKAELLVLASSESSAKFTPDEVPAIKSSVALTTVQQAELAAISAKAVEAQPAVSPSAEKPTVSPTEGAGGAPPVSPNAGAEGAPAAPTAAPSAAPTPAPGKSFSEQIKEFFTNFIAKIMALFTGKKVEEPKPVEAPKPIDKPTPAPAAEQPSNPESLNGPDTTVGLSGQALVNNPQFLARTEQIAAKIGGGTTRDDLLTIMNFETARTMNPKIKNPLGSASGLIQFIDTTATGLGTTTAALRDMSGLQQLDYVEKYFQKYFGKLKNGFSDLYRVIFWPAAIGKGPDYIFADAKRSPAYIVSQNPGFAKDTNGFITNRSFETQCSIMRKNCAIGPQAASGPIANA